MQREGGRVMWFAQDAQGAASPGSMAYGEQTMETPQQLALAAQAPLPRTVAADADARAEMLAEIRIKFQRLQFTREAVKAFILASLQVEEWDEHLMTVHADFADLSLILDRLTALEEGAAHQYRTITHNEFWALASERKVLRFKALAIRDAWTNGETVDWASAYEELVRRFGGK